MSTQNNNNGKKYDRLSSSRHIFELVLFAVLGALMFCSKIIMEMLPNIHLLGMFTVALTLVFRARALIPIYICVILTGLSCGFNYLWLPYIYIWTVLWAITILIPKKTPRWLLCIICPAICSFHGFLFGVLSAPIIALVSRFNFGETIAWIISGIPFDITHGIGNLFAGLLIVPLYELMKKLLNKRTI